uniref:L-rhamnose-binding lectin SML-like n=1 Tax=Monopterus albus TaxID=43700 RepID=UPI0009B3DDE3|nr:L-rhamnose-binding lectin SML-like [Monopterus albus]
MGSERVSSCDDHHFQCLNCAHTVACEGLVAHLKCAEGEVISVDSANYGRHDKTTCASGRPDSQIQNVQCSSPTSKVADRCNGKSTCDVSVNNSEFGDPCVGTYKYLEVTYKCQPHTVACEGSLAHLKCAEGQIISVDSANYGRHDQTTCVSGRPYSQIQNVQCSRPTSKVADSCNGKNSCDINANNSEFGDPCFGTYKYLEVTYRCQHPV